MSIFKIDVKVNLQFNSIFKIQFNSIFKIDETVVKKFMLFDKS